MKHYTDTIPLSLAEKLKEKGMSMPANYTDLPMFSLPTYGYVFDWLMTEKETYIRIIPFREVKEINGTVWAWSWFMNRLTQPSINSDNFWMNWHEAANAAIEKALELIK